MIEFKHRILMTGFGVVAQAALPMLLKHLNVPCRNITVIDFEDCEEVLRPWLRRGARFIRERVTPTNLTRLLSTNVGRGDLIIDLAWGIDFFDILEWAHNNQVLYVNASLESWHPSAEMASRSSIAKSQYANYAKLLPIAAQWGQATTAVIDHGANPGLVSHFVKQGLLDIAGKGAAREPAAPRSSPPAGTHDAGGEVRRAGPGTGREGHPLQRVGHAARLQSQAAGRVRGHVERGRHVGRVHFAQ